MLKQWASAYAYTVIFCSAIALVMWRKESGNLTDYLITSFSIGLPMCTIDQLLMTFGKRLQIFRRINPIIRRVLLSAICILIGVLLAGWIVFDNALYYFRVAPMSLWAFFFFGTVGSTIYLSHLRIHESKAKLAKAAAKEVEQSQLAVQSQLAMLQAQIEPHFLFNTLSNIHSLIDDRPSVAQQTLENLSVLLRRSFERTREQLISLEMEIDIIRAYLDIQQIRMGDRLSYSLDIPYELQDIQVPPLILQPLVENAVVHGLDTATGGLVTVQVRRVGEKVALTVVDNGNGIDVLNSRPKNHGIGLKNTRERLYALYNNSAEFSLAERSVLFPGQRGCIATITLPLLNQTSVKPAMVQKAKISV